MGLQKREHKIYANIISDGSIRVNSTEDNPDTVRRDWKLQNGDSGTKYELVYEELSGFIKGIYFQDGKYGKSLRIVVQDEEEIILTVNMQSNYSDDLMKKLPNIDINKEVTFKPYSFEDKAGKLKRGVTVFQEEEKLKSFFHSEDQKELHGFPAPEKSHKKMDNDDWKVYFIGVKKFLQKYLEDNTKLIIEHSDNESKKEEIDVEEIDFDKKPEATKSVDTTVPAEPPFKSEPKKESAASTGMSDEEKQQAIRALVIEKTGKDDGDGYKITAMGKTNLPFLPANYDKMIEILSAL